MFRALSRFGFRVYGLGFRASGTLLRLGLGFRAFGALFKVWVTGPRLSQHLGTGSGHAYPHPGSPPAWP